MTYATLKYELSDSIATVTINRPEKNNAISMEMRADFRALADELYGNEAVRVAVFTGRGQNLCGGGDAPAVDVDLRHPPFPCQTRLPAEPFHPIRALPDALHAPVDPP